MPRPRREDSGELFDNNQNDEIKLSKTVLLKARTTETLLGLMGLMSVMKPGRPEMRILPYPFIRYLLAPEELSPQISSQKKYPHPQLTRKDLGAKISDVLLKLTEPV
jgi:hypothetical protein